MQAGAVVRYEVNPVYSIGLLPEISSEELEQNGITGTAQDDFREIRDAEQHVPRGLSLTAWLLKANEQGDYTDKQEVITNQTVINPVETDVSCYEVGRGTSIQKVNLKSGSIEEIAKIAGITVDHCTIIQEVANSINPTRYDQLIAPVEEKVEDISDKRRLRRSILKLQNNDKIMLYERKT